MPVVLAGSLPHDATLRPLIRHTDLRGDLHELTRESWNGGFAVAQWNALQSRAGVLRGMAVHMHMTDCYFNVQGRALLGLCDLRPHSPTYRHSCVIALDGACLGSVTVPIGVAHGLYFETDCLSLAAFDSGFDPADKLGCRWDDPLLAIPWPRISPQLVERDRSWPPAEVLLKAIAQSRHLSGKD